MIQIKTIINNLSINYIKKGNGKVVLILPGWGTTINTYMSIINSISTYSTVYCLDMPGFGESEEPNASWNLDNYVEFVIQFLKNQNIKEVDLIGHSNGGRIIIKMMSKENLNFKSFFNNYIKVLIISLVFLIVSSLYETFISTYILKLILFSYLRLICYFF